MFRKESLINNNLNFNSKLSSSADRYFQLELAKKKLKGAIVSNGGELYYRIHINSMSHKLTLKLVSDTKKYYSELLKYNFIPKNIRRKALSKGYYVICGSYYNLKNIKVIPYAFLSFIYSPGIFIGNVFKLNNRI
jgi:hypothetical protein